jgi:signal transduction histidine kinase
MLTPAIPANEVSRLKRLHSYRVLDTMPEQVYDDLTRIAAEICDTPIALVSLVDSDRQWFKSRVGLDAAETARDVSFCGHAVAGGQLLVVPDARRDPRFADNPLVRGAPDIRFYAGAPLVTPNEHVLGTLCVIDRRPRRLDHEQTETLLALARQVVAHLELRLTLRHLEEERERCHRAMHVRSEFLARMGHELRTPLNSILGYGDLLGVALKDVELPNECTGYLAQLVEAGEHLLALVEDVLDFRQIEVDRVHLRLQDVPVAPLAEAAVGAVVPTAMTNGSRVLLDPVDPNLRMRTDPIRVQQCLLNLLANAARFTANGRIRLVVSTEGDDVCFLVEDNGIGIAAEALERIFEPFEQADADTAERYGGTGLGLAITRRLAARLGGEVGATSTLGEGSRFLLRLPRTCPEEATN